MKLTLVPMAPKVMLADDEGNLVPVRIGVWRACVGRVSLYLLDTKVEGNPDWARDVTNTLYGGDRRNRLRQELVLGIGGVRVLRGLGLEPTVFHLNEGHSAFLQLERMRELVEEQGLSADEALKMTGLNTVFQIFDTEADAIAGFYRSANGDRRTAADANILCVEQSPNVLAYVSQLLRQAGYVVVTTGNMPDALTLLTATRPKVVITSAAVRAARNTRAAERFNELVASTT